MRDRLTHRGIPHIDNRYLPGSRYQNAITGEVDAVYIAGVNCQSLQGLHVAYGSHVFSD